MKKRSVLLAIGVLFLSGASARAQNDLNGSVPSGLGFHKSPAPAGSGVHPTAQCARDAKHFPDFAESRNSDDDPPANVLCRGARSSAPLECYLAAKKISDDLFGHPDDRYYDDAALQFCKGSGREGRVECYKGLYNLNFSRQGRLEFCGQASNTDPVTCYEEAIKAGIPASSAEDKPYSKAYNFCANSGSLGRMNCFEEARKILADDDKALTLCTGASDDDPVKCYISKRQDDSKEARVLRHCGPGDQGGPGKPEGESTTDQQPAPSKDESK